VGYLEPLDFVVIGTYAIFTILVGLWCGRKQKSTEEYFVASRDVGFFVVGMSMVATLLSTISYLVIPGEMVKNGPGLMWMLGGPPLAFLVVGFFVIPRIMQYKVTSDTSCSKIGLVWV